MENKFKRYHRRSIRLNGYDYSGSGAYFVTVCTNDKECLFGNFVDGKMYLNDAGRAVEACWLAIPDHFPNIELDEFVIMPNHIHGIIVITPSTVGATHASPLQRQTQTVSPTLPGPKPKSIGAIIGSFKSAASKKIHTLPNFTDTPAWQRNYFEHVIRDENSLNRIRQYILDNPAQWAFDRENPWATTQGHKTVCPAGTKLEEKP